MPAAAARRWADAMLASLSLEQKAAQLVTVRIDASASADAEQRARFARLGVGGLIVASAPALDVAAELNRLQQLATLPLLVAADVERGAGQRLLGATEFPPLATIGATGDERLAYDLGRITALECRAVGVHMAYAPVLDVHTNPANPIIGTRSYGADPHAVARLGRAHIRGLQEHGVLATAKHFPGHGDTARDSHVELPTVHIDAARAEAVELAPFRAAIEAGVAAVMLAHVAYPALGADGPATFALGIATALLRERLGFGGLVVSDALDMGAVTRTVAARDAARLALDAGIDVLLMPPDPEATIAWLVEDVRAGRIAEARLDVSVRRLLGLKWRADLHRTRTVDLSRAAAAIADPAHRARAAEAAQRGADAVRAC